MTETQKDLVVLGGGSGGYSAALRAAELGRSVALIERDRVGGTCLHRGCIPTKALLHAGEIADQTRETALFGVNSTFEGIDMAGVQKYKDAIVSKNWRGLSGLLDARGITVVEGHGRLVGPTTVQVDGDTYTGASLVLATGSYSRTLPGLEIDGDRVLTSEHALELDRIPQSAIVVGGGVIGCEFSSAWASFGSKVTVVEALPQLLPNEDPAAAKLLDRAFRRRKIGIKLGARFARSERTDAGVRITLEDGDVLEAEVVLVAVGRGPVSADLGYEDQGVRLDGGYVVTDEYLRTSVDGVYAVGDLVRVGDAPHPQLAHVGFAEGILVAEQIAGLPVVPIDYAGVPRITYSRPEVASVGLTEAQANEVHGAERVRAVTYDLAGNGRSAILNARGAVKVVALDTGIVVGVHIVGDRVGELIAEAQLIYNLKPSVDDLARLLHPHPTQAESIGEALLMLAGKPLHVHG